MAAKKKYRTSFMGGYRKRDVNAYVDNLVGEFNKQQREKDIEIAMLKGKLADVEGRFEDVSRKYDTLENDRQNIANALIQASDKADRIVEEAKARHKDEMAEFDRMLNAEKEKIVEMKKQVRSTRTLILEIMKNFEEATGKIVDDAE